MNITQNRFLALDTLRGYALFTMVLSGILPFWGVLPSWMYHAQLPPPLNKFNPLVAGITWVDLVFPFFLFAMGAAIPLANARKLAKGESWQKIHLEIIWRSVLLVFFAIALQHIRPHTILNTEPLEARTCFLALLGFVLFFLIYWRTPTSWSPVLRYGLQAVGFVGIVIFLSQMRYASVNPNFDLMRRDIIILVLANMALFGGFLWLWTQKNMPIRLALVALLVALRLSSTVEGGWAETLFQETEIKWLFSWNFLKYLFIVLPATLVGEWMLSLSNSNLQTDEAQTPANGFLASAHTVRFLSVIGFLLVLICLIGLQWRMVVPTTILAAICCGVALHLTKDVTKDGMKNGQNSTEQLLRNLALWGSFWVLLGLMFEPYEGGIKKDHATYSYFFLTSGLAHFVLLSLTIWIEVWQKSKYFSWLIGAGQNPLLGYVLFHNFILPILTLTGVAQALSMATKAPWLGFIRAFGYTLLTVWLVTLCTRRNVFWRA